MTRLAALRSVCMLDTVFDPGACGARLVRIFARACLLSAPNRRGSTFHNYAFGAMYQIQSYTLYLAYLTSVDESLNSSDVYGAAD